MPSVRIFAISESSKLPSYGPSLIRSSLSYLSAGNGRSVGSCAMNSASFFARMARKSFSLSGGPSSISTLGSSCQSSSVRLRFTRTDQPLPASGFR
ncbi:hypothetical protein KC360_g210 [Hortaea werneckii]|nr:hypothetical protein KC360_g210 [Hortaea werneckii]